MTATTPRPVARLRSQPQLLRLIDRLIDDYPDHSAGCVIRSVVVARERLLSEQRYQDLVDEVEALARRRIESWPYPLERVPRGVTTPPSATVAPAPPRQPKTRWLPRMPKSLTMRARRNAYDQLQVIRDQRDDGNPTYDFIEWNTSGPDRLAHQGGASAQ